MASASALAGAFTTLGVSANRAAAKKTNVVAKKVRVLEMPSRPNESTRASTSSFPREDSRARRGSHARRSARLARPPRAPSTGDRCPNDGDRATRAARTRTPPIRSGVARLFSSPTGQFPTRGLPFRAPLADPASSPRSIRRLSPRARRSAPSSVISRYVSAPLREVPNPASTDMFLPLGVLSVSEEKDGTGRLLKLSSRRAARRARGADPARRRSGRGTARPRVRADPGGARITRARLLRAPPRVPAGAMEAVARSIQSGYRADPALERRAPFVARDVAGKNAAAFFFRARSKKRRGDGALRLRARFLLTLPPLPMRRSPTSRPAPRVP